MPMVSINIVPKNIFPTFVKNTVAMASNYFTATLKIIRG